MARLPALVAFVVAAGALAGCLSNAAHDTVRFAEVVDPGATLRVTVHAAPGMELEPQAVEDWLDLVREVRGGEVVLGRGSGLAVEAESDLDEVFDLGKDLLRRGPRPDERTVPIPMLLLDRSEYPGLAGFTGSITTYQGRQVFIVIFVGALREAAYFPLGDPLPLPSPAPSDDLLMLVERAVLVHEFGHAMGLVGCDLPEVRPHESPEWDCHSSNEESVMWFATHGSQDLRKLIFEDGLGPIWQYDADDLADVRAAQETLAAGGSLRESWR